MFKKLKLKNTRFFIAKQITLPVILLIIALIFVTIYSFNVNKKQIQENAYNSLKYYSYKCESDISEIINSAEFLQTDDSLIYAMQNSNTELDADTLYNVKSTLNNLINKYKIVDSVFIMNTATGYIIDSEGIWDFDEYLYKKYNYSLYNNIFWKSVTFLSNSQYRVYSPSTVHTVDTTKNIIPIAFNKLGKVNCSSFLMVNISVDTLMKIDENTDTTYGQNFILNKLTGNIFSVKQQDTTQLNNNTELYTALISGKNNFDIELPEYKKCTIVAASESDSLIGYTYFAIIPYKEITKSLLLYILVVYLTSFFFIIITIMLSLRNAKNIADPVEQIANILNADTGANIFDSIKKTSEEMSQINQNLTNTLPLAVEQFLVNYLNSDITISDNESLQFLRDNLKFENDYFAVIILRLYPTNQLYNDYSKEEFSNFRKGFYDIVKQSFLDKFNAFFISSEKNSLYIILNLESDKTKYNLENILNESCKLLDIDSQYIICYTGLSSIHKSFEGLKEAHLEAIQNLKISTSTPNEQINLDIQKQILFKYSAKDEQALLNALISGDIESANELITNINKSNSSIDIYSKKQLYVQIFNTICHALHLKHIPLSDEKLDFEVYADLMVMPAEELYANILQLVVRIPKKQAIAQTLSGDNRLIDYINENYTSPDISLDQIAEVFNTTPSYVSTIVKQKLGIGFVKHIANMRMAEAMRLLTETKEPISDIYQKAGFSSKQAFYRTFKNATGITPSDYRRQKGIK